MKADFPQKKQSSKIKKQNEELKKKFKFGGYPSVYIINHEEKVLGKIGGYGGWDTKEYIAKISRILD